MRKLKLFIFAITIFLAIDLSNVFAMDISNENELLNCISKSDSVCTLIKDIEFTKNIEIERNITFELNGYNLTASKDLNERIFIIFGAHDNSIMPNYNLKLITNSQILDSMFGPLKIRNSAGVSYTSKIKVLSYATYFTKVTTEKELVNCLVNDPEGCKLVNNIEFTKNIIIPKDFTILLNGYSLTAKDGTENIKIVPGDNATFIGNDDFIQKNFDIKLGPVSNGKINLDADIKITWAKEENSSSTSTTSSFAEGLDLIYNGTTIKENGQNSKSLKINPTNLPEINGVFAETLKTNDNYKKYQNVSAIINITNGNNEMKNKFASRLYSIDKNAILNNKIYNISIHVINENTKEEIDRLTELNKPIILHILIPEEWKLANSNVERKYYVLREHKGYIDILNTETTEDGNYISFRTDKFSNYALAYVDNEFDTTIIPPQTLDNINIFIFLGGVALLSLLASGIYIYSKNK